MKKIINLFFIISLSLILLTSCFFSKNVETTPLSQPQNLRVQGTLLFWDSVENASGYTILVNNQTADCNSAPFELIQLSLTDGSYYVMVKARGTDNYTDSDYSMAIEYVVGNTNTESNPVNNNNVDTSLARSKNRYAPIQSPMINNAPPLIASSTDYTNNYYLIDGGYVLNTPISSGFTLGYNGQTPISVIFEKSTVKTTKVEEALEKTAVETVNTIKTGSADVKINVEVEKEFKKFIDKLSVGAEFTYSRQWGTITENSNSVTSTYLVANEIAESITQSISYTIGNHNEAPGDYRLSMVTTCDVYYLVTTNYDNTELVEISMALCARPDVKFVLEYSEDGRFDKTSELDKFDFSEDFYKNYPIPTEVLTGKINFNVDGGLTLDQTSVTVALGQKTKLPVPMKYEHAFVGWFSYENGQGVKYADYNGNMYDKWAIREDITLYACWTPTVAKLSDVNQLRLNSQQTESEKSTPFGIGLDINRLKEAGYTKLNISISGACSEYYYKLNDRTRYFRLYDAVTDNKITEWAFIVQNFSGVNANTIDINAFNTNGLYKLQLASDKSDAWDEKLLVSGIIITVVAVK